MVVRVEKLAVGGPLLPLALRLLLALLLLHAHGEIDDGCRSLGILRKAGVEFGLLGQGYYVFVLLQERLLGIDGLLQILQVASSARVYFVLKFVDLLGEGHDLLPGTFQVPTVLTFQLAIADLAVEHDANFATVLDAEFEDELVEAEAIRWRLLVEPYNLVLVFDKLAL